MSTSGISPIAISTIFAKFLQNQKPQAPPPVSRNVQEAYSVSLSSQALFLSSDGDTSAQEVTESPEESSAETAEGVS